MNSIPRHLKNKHTIGGEDPSQLSDSIPYFETSWSSPAMAVMLSLKLLTFPNLIHTEHTRFLSPFSVHWFYRLRRTQTLTLCKNNDPHFNKAAEKGHPRFEHRFGLKLGVCTLS